MYYDDDTYVKGNDEYSYSNEYTYYDDTRSRSGGSTGGNGGSGGGKKKKKGGFFRSVMKALCLGLVFGLAASGAMFGFYKVTGTSIPVVSSAQESTATPGSVQIVQTSSSSADTVQAGGVADIVSQVMPSIVAVNTESQQTVTDWFGRQYTQNAQGAGSGIILSEDGDTLYIMTNYHVVKGATQVSVKFSDETTAEATVKGYDEDADIAVILIDMDELSADTKDTIRVAVMGDSDNLKVGESAIAIGNALGYGQSVTTGVVSAVSREVQLTDKTMTLLQTSAAINPGNSGGALLNGNGEVIGVNTVKYEDTSVEGMGYAIPINSAIETAKAIIDGTLQANENQEAYLGIRGGTIDEETAKTYNAPAGVYISSVESGSAAQRAGLQAGCIITAFNGETISTMEELQEALAGCSAGDSVTITVSFPSGKEYVSQDLTTILGSKSDASDIFGSEENAEYAG